MNSVRSISGILYDRGQEIGHVQTGRPDHLRHQGGAGHTRNRIDFQEVKTVFPIDIIHPDHTGAAQPLVNQAGRLPDPVGMIFRNRGRADFLAVAIVFRIIVEILIGRHDLDDRKGTDTVCIPISGAGEFPAGDALLHDDRRRRTLRQRLAERPHHP